MKTIKIMSVFGLFTMVLISCSTLTLSTKQTIQEYARINEKTSDEHRELLIKSMTREELIDFIRSKDSFYSGEDFTGYKENLLLAIAIFADLRADRQEQSEDTDTSDTALQKNKQDWRQQDYRMNEYLKALADFTKKISNETKNKS